MDKIRELHFAAAELRRAADECTSQIARAAINSALSKILLAAANRVTYLIDCGKAGVEPETDA